MNRAKEQGILRFSDDHLQMVKELAETKTLKEIAAHLNMSWHYFKLLRKAQPEINAIFYGAKKARKNKIYTKEEIEKIAEMVRTMPMNEAAKSLGISMPTLDKARGRQPELDQAIIEAIEERPSNFNYLAYLSKQKQSEESAKPKVQPKTKELPAARNIQGDSLLARAPEHLSEDEALRRFYKLLEADRTRQRLNELRKIDL